tara:strand:- start:488 stop:1069 length:582 start_codon:yes stop_codon:yes gene_type:complete
VQSLDQVKNNVRHGISKRYSEDGSLVQILRFKNGEQINKTIIYYKDCFDNVTLSIFNMEKTYRLYSQLSCSPSEHWGVPREQCKCDRCPNAPIKKTSVEYYTHGEEYYVGEETFIMESLDAAKNYFMAKYEDDEWDSSEYIYDSDYLRDEKLTNPNYNDEEEFSAGIGDEQMDVIKVELYEDETERLLQTTDP